MWTFLERFFQLYEVLEVVLVSRIFCVDGDVLQVYCLRNSYQLRVVRGNGIGYCSFNYVRDMEGGRSGGSRENKSR